MRVCVGSDTVRAKPSVLYRIVRWLHFTSSDCMQVHGDGILDQAKCLHYRTCLLFRGVCKVGFTVSRIVHNITCNSYYINIALTFCVIVCSRYQTNTIQVHNFVKTVWPQVR